MLFIFEQSSIFKYRRFYRLLRAIILYGCATLVAMPVYSSQALYSLFSTQNIIQQGTGNGRINQAVGQVRFNNKSLSNLAKGVVIDVPLPRGKMAKGRVITSRKKSRALANSAALSGIAAETRQTIISLDQNAGSVELTLTNNSVTKMILHDTVSESIYLADINTNGDGQLRLQDNNDFYCVDYPQNNIVAGIAQQTSQIVGPIPDINTLGGLQGRPGSANVLYLDFWGGTLNDSYWNANYTSNAPIEYTAFDQDGDPGSFTDTERYSIWLAWRETIEDFAPFDINITTDRSIYEAAAVTNRSRMIITTTKNWYSSTAGGVAVVDSFDDDKEFTKVAWAWNLLDVSLGMTISHEAGHQMSLGHDGIDSEIYYIGHESWGPIMGAPFGKPYVQWSKGDYPGANQNEDDVVKVSEKLGLISDEAGDDFANATLLNLPVNETKGVIGFGDTDTYKFTLKSPGQVDIGVKPLLGDFDESRAANLAMNVLLVKLNTSGGVESNINGIDSSDIVPLSPLTNVLAYSGSLDAGTYGLRISPNSPDTNWATGFDNYGNAGEYLLSVNATSQLINTLGRPPIDRSVDTGLFIWQNAKNKWALHVVSGDMARTVEFDVVSNLGITNVVPLSIEPSDELIQLPKSLNLKLNIKAPWVDGIKFTVNNQSDTCISMTNADVPIYMGPDRVLMPAAFDLNTLSACNQSSVATLGPPPIDRSADVGIFIWERTLNTWVVNVVAGEGNGDGGALVVDLDVASDQPLSNIVPISIESNDLFTQLPNSLDMSLNVNAPWMDGFVFTVVDQSNTCISTTNADLPIYLGPQRINVGNNMNLNSLAICD